MHTAGKASLKPNHIKKKSGFHKKKNLLLSSFKFFFLTVNYLGDSSIGDLTTKSQVPLRDRGK